MNFNPFNSLANRLITPKNYPVASSVVSMSAPLPHPWTLREMIKPYPRWGAREFIWGGFARPLRGNAAHRAGWGLSAVCRCACGAAGMSAGSFWCKGHGDACVLMLMEFSDKTIHALPKSKLSNPYHTALCLDWCKAVQGSFVIWISTVPFSPVCEYSIQSIVHQCLKNREFVK